MAERRELDRRGAARTPAARSDASEISAFLDAARAPGRPAPGSGRLVFALDATMSRQPTWDAACALQGEMFRAASRTGTLQVQLAYFRGRDEARASRWVVDAESLSGLMRRVACHGGLTQIGRILDHVGREAGHGPAPTLVFVGDAMEEDVDALCAKAGELSLRGVRAFMFLEGSDPAAERAFREIARLTGGCLLPFDRGAAQELAALLGAVAAFAAGGFSAIESDRAPAAKRLLADLRR